METFWVVAILISHPSEAHVIDGYSARGHYATKVECFVHAGELALDFVHQQFVATRCEARLGHAPIKMDEKSVVHRSIAAAFSRRRPPLARAKMRARSSSARADRNANPCRAAW